MCPAKLKDEDVYYTKENVSLCEYKIHKYVYNLKIVNIPKIKSYNRKTKQLKMVFYSAMHVGIQQELVLLQAQLNHCYQ